MIWRFLMGASCVWVVALVICAIGAAEEPAAPAPGEQVTDDQAASLTAQIQQIESQRAVVESATGLSDETKAKAVGLLTDAANRLGEAQRLTQQRAAMQQRLASAPDETAQINTALEPPPAPAPIADEAGPMTDAQVEAKEQQASRELQATEQRLETISKRLTEQRDRPKVIAERVGSLKADQQRISDDLAAVGEMGEPSAVSDARRTALGAHQEEIRAAIALLELESSGHETLLALRTAQRDQAARALAEAQRQASAWSQINSERQQQATRRAAARAEAAQRAAESAQVPVPLRSLAEGNVRLAERLQASDESERALADRLQRVSDDLRRVQRQFTKAKLRLEAAGPTLSNGMLLRDMQDRLPARGDLGIQQRSLSEEIGTAEADVIDLEETRADLAERADEREAVLQEIRAVQTPPQAEVWADQVDDLLEQQSELVEQLLAAQRRRLTVLIDLRQARQELSEVSAEFNRFIAENLLWARSMPAVAPADVREMPRGVVPLLLRKNWIGLGRDIRRAIEERPEAWALAMLLFVAAVFARVAGPRRLATIAPRIGHVETDSFRLTLEAVLISVMMALPGPIVLWMVARQIELQAESELFSAAIAAGLMRASNVWLTIALILAVVRDNGLGPAHFRWRPNVCALVRRCTIWFYIPAPVLWTLIVATEYYDHEFFRRTIGRPALILMMLIVLPLIIVLFRPGGAVHRGALARPIRSFIVRTWRLWFAALVLVPPVVIVLSMTGYFYTAMQLDLRVGATLKLVLLLLLASELLIRWLRVEHRRLIQRELASRAEQDADDADGASPDEPAPSDADPELIREFEAVRHQTRALINAAMLVGVAAVFYAIWSPLLPALGYFENVRLWSYPQVVAGEHTVRFVTLLSLGMAVVASVVAWVAAKNLPGLLELIVLSRLPLDAGSRYAIQSVFRYLIIAAAAIYIFTTLGMQWDRLQWLIAALSVGLGFGLQEIVANFVCGLIILAERPYRIGDRITVGTQTGTVSRIQIRATTILNFDRQEIIIPNKTLITSQVTNWSLTDEVSRLVIPVILHPGVDVEKVRQTLVGIAQAHQHVMDDPEPSADLTQFVDGTLQFSLRAYVRLEHRLQAQHELHAAIDRQLRDAGIPLAAPQREVRQPPEAPQT